MITKEEFEKMCTEFLETQTKCGRDEYYCSQYALADTVLDTMREYFFYEDIAKEARRAQYEELKKEFE